MTKLSLKQSTDKSGNRVLAADTVSAKITKVKSATNSIKIMHGKCTEALILGQCVTDTKSIITQATPSTRGLSCSGVAFYITAASDAIGYINNGTYSSPQYKFSAPFGKPLWVGYDGQPTDKPHTYGKTQIIGFSVDETTAFFTISDAPNTPIYKLTEYKQQKLKTLWTIPVKGLRLGPMFVYTMEGKKINLIDPTHIEINHDNIKISFNEPNTGFVLYSVLN